MGRVLQHLNFWQLPTLPSNEESALNRNLPDLTERQNEVLKWMVEGKRNAEIGTILHLSPRTVEKHVAEILKHLKVENRASAIVNAMGFAAAETQKDSV